MASAIWCAEEGWRARTDDDFTDENIVRAADAVARLWAEAYAGASLYIGYDARPVSEHAALLAAAVLGARGFTVRVSAGVCPKPAVAWAVAADADACGGIMVSGGRRPVEHNGMSLIEAEGQPATRETYACFESAVRADAIAERGAFERVDLVAPYADALAAFAPAEADAAAASVRVVCDPLYGAAQGVLPRVLERLGFEAHEIHRGPYQKGAAVHPDPVEPWVDDCEQAVTDAQAWAGLVLDGDGSSFGAVDERGRFVGPQFVTALVLGYLVEQCGVSGRVVAPSSVSTVVRRQAKRLGCPLTVTGRSLKRLCDEMGRGNALIVGAEWENAAIPAHVRAFDGLLIHVLLCRLMAHTGKPLGVLVDELGARVGKMAYGQRDVLLEPEVIESFRMVAPGLNPREVAGMEPVEVSHLDGLRLGFPDGSWLLLRPRASAPHIRLSAEATSRARLSALLDAGEAIARGPAA